MTLNMNASSSFARSLWLVLAMLAVLTIAFAIYVWAEKQIDRANEMRHQSFLLVNELRQSSDDLTNMARIYVVTGDPHYKTYYQDILDIRNGKKPRPKQYQQAYWTFVIADGKPQHADNQRAVALLDLMQRAGFTQQELNQLTKAKQNSDDLTAIELEAMRLVAASHPDASLNKASALNMLHDKKYHQLKAAIMRPIDKVYTMMGERTLKAVQATEMIASILRILLIMFALGLVLSLRRTYNALKTTLGGSVDEVQAQIAKIGSEDLTSAFVVADAMQNTVLGWIAKKQAKLIEVERERKLSEAKLIERESHLRAIIDNEPECIKIVDAQGRLKEMNPAGLAMIEADALAQVAGHAVENLIAPEHRAAFANMHKRVLAGESMQLEFEVIGLKGGRRWLETHAVPMQEGGENLHLAVTRDVTLRKAATEKIESLAFYDPLTHLPNRRLLVDRLNQALSSSTRLGKDGALLFLDLDHFKTLNDTVGHDTGDLLLQQVAERLIASVREGDTVARIGGDEFVVMLENLNGSVLEVAAQVEVIGRKILNALNMPYQLAGYEYQSTASIGVALFSTHDQSQEEMLKHADIAMYQAKKSGRNALRFFDPLMQEAVNTRAEIERELRKALELQQFALYYQTQVDSAGRVVGAEALIRWLHPERGLVSPFQFIPLAEESRLIVKIGHWVLDTACAQLKVWQQDTRTQHLTLSINVSAKQFHQADFVSQVQQAAQRHSINPTLLKLELTESILLEHVADTVAIMNALKDIGVRFALDDFGTGYSSLQYLKQLPLDQLKIDQSFVRDIAMDSSDEAIVRTIIVMAHTLNLNVIAEGVETEVQKSLLMDSGCKFYQGYLFSRPVPIEQFEALLKLGESD
ncbi:MAG: EAL domain-containing protein [Methylotenera sp.]|nr:EAL domain-containing protein [Methylotenera sp.]MDP2281401.1 EAL domain-containing protein [Methylotenera sp.]MDP3060229.1 EAL domain-containing protein [Methylotenera sp.]